MSASFETTNPGSVKFTLTVTLTLDEWRKVESALKTEKGIVGWPIWNAVSNMVQQATRPFYPSPEVLKDG